MLKPDTLRAYLIALTVTIRVDSAASCNYDLRFKRIVRLMVPRQGSCDATWNSNI